MALEIIQPGKSLVTPLTTPKVNPSKSLRSALIIVGIFLAGTASGWVITKLTTGSVRIGGGKITSSEDAAQAGVKVGDIIGAIDERPFKDTTEGVLVEGGADGEGSHHLLRSGGPSKNAYLTSSVVDLSMFVGHRIQIWGETFSAQRAGWLMDVGRVKVLELNATPPFEE